MSGTNPHRLSASLRRLAGRQNRSESHLPDISTGPEQFEGEYTVRFATFAVHLYSLCLPALSDAIASTETRD